MDSLFCKQKKFTKKYIQLQNIPQKDLSVKLYTQINFFYPEELSKKNLNPKSKDLLDLFYATLYTESNHPKIYNYATYSSLLKIAFKKSFPIRIIQKTQPWWLGGRALAS